MRIERSGDNSILDRITEIDELKQSFQFKYDSCIFLVAQNYVDTGNDFTSELMEYYNRFINLGYDVDYRKMKEDVLNKVASIKQNLGLKADFQAKSEDILNNDITHNSGVTTNVLGENELPIDSSKIYNPEYDDFAHYIEDCFQSYSDESNGGPQR